MDAAPAVETLPLSPLLLVPPSYSTLSLGHPCEWCCAWALPLGPPYAGRKMSNGAALAYPEWLVWHWHVMQHQRGVPLC